MASLPARNLPSAALSTSSPTRNPGAGEARSASPTTPLHAAPVGPRRTDERRRAVEAWATSRYRDRMRLPDTEQPWMVRIDNEGAELLIVESHDGSAGVLSAASVLSRLERDVAAARAILRGGHLRSVVIAVVVPSQAAARTWAPALQLLARHVTAAPVAEQVAIAPGVWLAVLRLGEAGCTSGAWAD